MGGSAVAALISIHLSAGTSSAVTVAVLKAAGTGFTGSLSTVSTFVNELNSEIDLD